MWVDRAAILSARVLECLRTESRRALGKHPGQRSAAMASLLHPRPTGGPLGAPSADNTEALPGVGGDPQGRKETRQRERTTSLESVTVTLRISVSQPSGVTQRVSLAHQPQTSPHLFLTFQLQGKRQHISDGVGSLDCLHISFGPRESLKSLLRMLME